MTRVDPTPQSGVPGLSVVIASYNSAPFLAAAVNSALAQQGVAVEVIVVDDGSGDGSFRIAQDLAARDPRVVALRTPSNGGPGQARSLGFAAARAPWIAVLDSDDLFHPDRARQLLDAAESDGADMVADDLLLFDDALAAPPTLFLKGHRRGAPGWIGLADYLRETRMHGRWPNLGFLKPIFRADFLARHRLDYDPRLRVAEDDALVIACLAAGARYRLVPRPLYFYRKHAASISHRLSPAHADAMKAVSDEFLAAASGWPRAAMRAMARRARATETAWAYAHLLEDLTRRDIAAAIARSLRHPSGALLLRQAVSARLGRLARRCGAAVIPARRSPVAAAQARLAAVVISRQRLVGAVNGSSAYLLALVRELVEDGYAVHLLQPGSAVFGRTPVQRPDADMQAFATHAIRGAVRIGGRFVTVDPSVYAGAVRGALSRIAAKLGLARWLPDRPAPYSVSVAWRDDDFLWLAAHARLRPRLILADYAFSGAAVPYLLAPGAASATVMHDCFHARADQFSGEQADSVARLDAATEARMLSATDAVIAIQPDEAAWVSRTLPASRVITAPMPARLSPSAEVGRDDSFLFVGSNTAPNIHGLAWFLDTVWPIVRAARPMARLIVAGSVRNGLAGRTAPGVEMAGIVPDLAPLYRAAGVIVSPLRQGSGLKIKLIEALAAGKACVATPVTLQGVEWLAPEAVVAADSPADFAAACIALAADPARRLALAEAAHAAARTHFSSQAALADFRDWALAALEP